MNNDKAHQLVLLALDNANLIREAVELKRRIAYLEREEARLERENHTLRQVAQIEGARADLATVQMYDLIGGLPDGSDPRNAN